MADYRLRKAHTRKGGRSIPSKGVGLQTFSWEKELYGKRSKVGITIPGRKRFQCYGYATSGTESKPTRRHGSLGIVVL